MKGKGDIVRRLLVAAVLLLAPAAAHAQVAWDTPLLVAPREPAGWGLYLAETSGGGVGVIGTWRSPAWNFGVRAGLADARNDVGILVGMDFEGALVNESPDFPMDVDYMFGAGIGTGDGARISLPAGIILGHTFPAEGATFTPYVSPRVVLDAFLNRDTNPEDESDAKLGFAVDLGLDLRLAATGFLIRFGATIGDRDGVALGLVF